MNILASFSFLISSFFLLCQRFNGSFIGLLVGFFAGLLVYTFMAFVAIYLLGLVICPIVLLPLGILWPSSNAT
jgi:hypothetical protein